MKLIRFEKEDEHINGFVGLPAKLYGKKDNMEDPGTMKKILLGEHPLSKYFMLDKYLVTDDAGTKATIRHI